MAVLLYLPLISTRHECGHAEPPPCPLPRSTRSQVNVHAAMDSGMRFFESANGVLLCEGFDGQISPEFFSVVVEVRGGLMLKPQHVRLIERLFAGCSRVTIKKMHGGFSGSLVLRTDSYDVDGHPEEPTVTKLDSAEALVREVRACTLPEAMPSLWPRGGVEAAEPVCPVGPQRRCEPLCGEPSSLQAAMLQSRRHSGAPTDDVRRRAVSDCGAQVHHTELITALAGSDAIRVLRGPLYVDESGRRVEVNVETAAEGDGISSGDGGRHTAGSATERTLRPVPTRRADAPSAHSHAPAAGQGHGHGAPRTLQASPLTHRGNSSAFDAVSSQHRALQRSQTFLRRRSKEGSKMHGAVVLEMAGACWVLPEFSQTLGKKELVSTLKEILVQQLGRLADFEGSKDVVAEMSDNESGGTLRVVRDLWGPGGPLAELISKSSSRFSKPATDARDGLINEWYESAVASAVIAFLPAHEHGELARGAGYEVPAGLRAFFSQLMSAEAGRFALIKKRQLWQDSFALQCPADVWGGAQCDPLVALLWQLRRMCGGPPPWLLEHYPLRAYQHGDLNAANVLIDVRSSLWLIDFASTGPGKNPFLDVAKMVSALLFEYFPIPISFSELRTAGIQKLKDAFGLPTAEVAEELRQRLVTPTEGSSHVPQTSTADLLRFADEFELEAEVRTRLGRVTNEATSQKRLAEGEQLVDALLAPQADGRVPELWEIGQRKASDSWPHHMQLTHNMCTSAVRLMTELVAKCSQREQAVATGSDAAECLPADLHVAHFLMPLLVRSLCAVRYSGLSIYQMRLAWYASQRLAVALSTALTRHPTPPPRLDASPTKELKLADGLPLLLLPDRATRLGGGEGEARLAVVDGAEGNRAITLGREVTQGITIDFDALSQCVLPFLTSYADAQPSLDEARALAQSLHMLQLLKDAANHRCDEQVAAASGLLPADTDALADHFAETLDQLGQVDKLLQSEVKDARKALAAAKRANANERRSLLALHFEDEALAAESVKVETRYARQLVAAATIDPAPVSAVEEDVIQRLRQSGAAGLRMYSAAQELTVLMDGKWRDVLVVVQPSAVGAPHRVRDLEEPGTEFNLILHPFNHGPRDVSNAAFLALQKRHNRSLRNSHSAIVDALSGKRLDVYQQCVPIEIGSTGTSSQEISPLVGISDVRGLASWLHGTHQQRTCGTPVTACVLLTAGPAAGKTCLMSQLVMHTLEQPNGLVPILIKVQNLQKRLLSDDSRETFASAWNWVDAHLQCVHGVDSEMYRMLRQAMLARRTLLLLDGLDEGGQVRSQIEKHVTEVLAPQGHVMLVTSRPAGVTEALFNRHFHRVVLRPLSEEQQKQVIEQRIVDEYFVAELMTYVNERVPRDVETGIRVTGNPLMLSMVVSIFESRVLRSRVMQSRVISQMPKTIAELYQVASSTMLQRVDRKERGAAASAAAAPTLRKLLEATFFQAHSAQRRIIDDEHLEAAALDLCDPGKLAELRWPEYDGQPSAGHYAQILTGEHTGRFATVTRVNPHFECAVEFEDGKRIAWVRVKSSGLRKAEFLAAYGDEARSKKVRQAVEALPAAMKEALATVRERVTQDRLPLLTLLTADPLEMQSSHLSFQEYFAANAMCKGWRLSKAAVAPWQWPVWWANALRLGSEMGEAFGRGLLESTDEDRRSAGYADGHLSLGGCIGGHRPTSLGAVAEMTRAATHVELPRNKISASEAPLFTTALRSTTTLTTLDLGFNDLGDGGVQAIASALAENVGCQLRVLDLTYNNFRARGVEALAAYVSSSLTIQELSLRNNDLGEEACTSLAKILGSRTLSKLDISGTKLTLQGVQLVADALRTNSSLTSLSLQDLDDYGLRSLGVALHANTHSRLSLVACDAFDASAHDAQHICVPPSAFGIGGAVLLASVLKVSTALSSVSLDDFAVPLQECLGSGAPAQGTHAIRLSIRGLPSVAVQYGLLLGSLLATNHHTTSATLLNDYGSTAGSDFALPLTQIAGEGSVMFVDMKGGNHSREHRAIIAGVVIGALIRVHQSLTRLDLRSCSLTVEGGKAIADALRFNTSITSLSLPDGQLGDEGVEHIATALRENEHNSITSINLSDNGVGARGALGMAEALRTGMTHLTSLDGVGMSGMYFKQLRGVDPVRSLDLKGLGDADAMVIGILLCHNMTLTSLDLGAASNTMGKLWGRLVGDALTTNTTLASLNLGSNGLGDAGGAAVADALHGYNFKLKSLDVSANRLGRAAARAFAAVLANEVNLLSLKLGSNELGDHGGRTIFEGLTRNSTLTELDVSSNKLGEKVADAKGGDDGAAEVSADLTGRAAGSKVRQSKASDAAAIGKEAIAVHTSQSQQVGCGVARAPAVRPLEKSAIDVLAVALRTNTALTALDLSNNGLSEKAMRTVAAAIKRNTSLVSLNGVGKSAMYFKALRSNRVASVDLKAVGLSAEDVTIICDLLSSNTGLQALDLSHNHLGDPGGKAIATALHRNDTVATLDLCSTGLGKVAGKAILEMLEKGTGITSLGLASNPMESDLKSIGFSAQKLKEVGLQPQQLRLGGFTADELRELGYKAKALKAAGFTVFELSVGGFPANQLKLAGFTDSELLAVGFTPQELRSKLGLEGVSAVRPLDLSVHLQMTWDKGSRDPKSDSKRV